MIKAVVFDYDWVLTRYYFLPQRELFDFAKDLRADGTKVAVLSNRMFPLTWLARLSGGLNNFDAVIFSRKTGAPKPDPQSYLEAAKALKLKPQECLFIDNRADNVAGAEDVGMPVLWAKSTEQTIGGIKSLLKASL